MPCSNTTTTSSGTFTVYQKEMTKCEAKQFCRDKGHILAPITTMEDRDAVHKMLDWNCVEHQGSFVYHLGLDITPCGKKQDRVFSNGLQFDEKVHGKLYKDFTTPDSKCPLAYLRWYADEPFVIGHEPQCHPQTLKFLCLDRSNAVASQIMRSDDKNIKISTTQALVAVLGVFAIFGGLIGKIYIQKKVLEKQVCEVCRCT